MVYLLGKRFNECVKNWGKRLYDGLVDILTKEIKISVPKAALPVVGGLVLAGCASAPLKPEEPKTLDNMNAEELVEQAEKDTKAAEEFKEWLADKDQPLPSAEEPPKETAEVEVKEQPMFCLGEIFDPTKPNMIGVQGNQTYDTDKNVKDINREVLVDLWQDIGKDLDLRLWMYDNHADCYRLLKSRGETAVHTLDIGAGLYKQLTDELKVGVVAEYLRQKFENAGTENQENVSAGLSAILDSYPFKFEIGALLGQGDGRFIDGSKFRDKNFFQAGAKGSLVISEDLGTVLTAIAQYGRSDQEQLGTDWHYSPEGRAGGLMLTQQLLSADGKGNGIDLAVYGQLSAGNYDIGPHNDLDMQRISLGFRWSMIPSGQDSYVINGFIGVFQQNNYPNQPLPGIPRIENGVEAGIAIPFGKVKGRGNEK